MTATRGTEPRRVAVIRHLREIERRMDSGREARRRGALDALNEVVRAAARTPAYRDLYGTDRPDPFRSLEDLASLPLMDRSRLGTYGLEGRLVPGAEPAAQKISGGTTGLVLESARSADEAALEDALFLRSERAQGLDPSAPHLVIAFGRGQHDQPLRIEGRRAVIGASRPGPELADAVRGFRPRVLAGVPSTLVELADHLGPHSVDGIITYGEILAPRDRAYLAQAFGVDPFDVYTSSESGPVAWQCGERDGYHVNDDAAIIEVLDERGRPCPPGEPGETALTVLWNRTTPFVRYQVGDIATVRDDRCPCGRDLPLMGQVEGRELDWLVAPDGSRRSPVRLWLGGLPPEWVAAVRRYRIVQRTASDFLVEVVWRDGPRPEVIAPLDASVARALGWPVTVEVREVEALSRTRSGKRLMTESWVRPVNRDR